MLNRQNGNRDLDLHTEQNFFGPDTFTDAVSDGVDQSNLVTTSATDLDAALENLLPSLRESVGATARTQLGRLGL